jgi:hypothetical protein
MRKVREIEARGCPFCGSSPDVGATASRGFRYEKTFTEHWVVTCSEGQNLGLHGPVEVSRWGTRNDAVTAWNERFGEGFFSRGEQCLLLVALKNLRKVSGVKDQVDDLVRRVTEIPLKFEERKKGVA